MWGTPPPFPHAFDDWLPDCWCWMPRRESGQPTQRFHLRDAGGDRDDDLMFGFAMDGLRCFMVALVTLLLYCPGPPWCTARHLVLWTGFPVLLPILLSVPATLTSPIAGKGTEKVVLQSLVSASWLQYLFSASFVEPAIRVPFYILGKVLLQTL